jgi:glycosyltransferase involved in cell wall biosynthesis
VQTLFSIIIPTFNSGKTLGACLDSIVQQSFQDYEVLVIDGVSGDETKDIVAQYASRYPAVRWFSEKDKGIYDAMNKGILHSKGKWLYFLGSDDALFDANVLFEIAQVVSSSGAEVVYGNVYREKLKMIYAGEFDIEKIYRSNICHQAIFFHRTIFDRTGLFDLSYKSNADYDHNLKWFFDDSIQKKFVDLIVANYCDDGLSSTFMDTAFRSQKPEQFLKLAGSRVQGNLRLRIISEIFHAKRKRKDLAGTLYFGCRLALLKVAAKLKTPQTAKR